MDYEKENIYLPTNIRGVVGEPNRITKQSDRTFMRMFKGQELRAVKNNWYASEMASGYNLSVHQSMLMSGLAPRLLDLLVRKIANKITFEGNDNSIADFMKIMKQSYFTRKLKEAFANSIKTGRDYLVLDYDKENNTPTIRNFDCFRGTVKQDLSGKIVEAKLYVSMAQYEQFEAYTIVEKRFYKKVKVDTGEEKVLPFQRFEVVKLSWQDDGREETEKEVYEDAKRIPQRVREEYNSITFNKDIPLDTLTLGVYLIDNTVYNTKYPYSKVPESQYVNLQDLLLEMDSARTFKEVDKNVGRGRAIVPELMGAQAQNKTRPMDRTYFEKYPTLSMEDSKPQAIQFDLRSEQWRTEIAGDTIDICAAFGVSVLDYDPTLLQAGQRTDDEINAMTDITYSTVMDKREIAEESINALLSELGELLGCGAITIRWNMSSILNPSKNTAVVSQKLSNGLISRRRALKDLNPDMSEADIDEELKAIEEEMQKSSVVTQAYEQF